MSEQCVKVAVSNGAMCGSQLVDLFGVWTTDGDYFGAWNGVHGAGVCVANIPAADKAYAHRHR
jgi:hypothetical protein